MNTVHGGDYHADPRMSREVLWDRLTCNSAGTGGLLLLSGAASSGKTQLLNDLLDHAAGNGVVTLSATGAQDEQQPGSGVVEQLFSGAALPGDVTERAEKILDVPSLPEMTSVIADCCRVVLDLARSHPVVVTVDDLQYAEDDALRLLLRLHRRIRSTRLLMVLALRDRPISVHSKLRARFAGQPHDEIHLMPWSAEAVRGLAVEAGIGGAEELTRRLHTLSGGNPRLVNALVEDYRAEESAPPGCGPAFAQSVRGLLHRLDPIERRVAGAAVVLNGDSRIEAVARLAGVGLSEAEEALETLAGTGAFGPDGLRHPGIQAPVLDCLDSTTLSGFHAAAADLLFQDHAPEQQVAAHLVESAASVPPWGIPVLVAAARQVASTGQNPYARRCLEAALKACDDPGQRHAILGDLAAIAWQTNPSTTVAYRTAPPACQAATSLGLAETAFTLRTALWEGDRVGVDAALTALTERPEPVTPQYEAECDLAVQWHFGPAAGRLGQERGSADPWHRVALGVAQLWTHGGSRTVAQNAERMLRNCRISSMSLEALMTSVLALARSNRTDAAAKWCSALSEEAAGRGATTWQAVIGAVWAEVSMRRGDTAAAAHLARSALDALGTRGWGASIFLPLTALVAASTAAGDFATAAESLELPVPEHLLGTVSGLRYLRAQGYFHLASGRVLAAVSDFWECGQLMAAVDADHPALIPWRTDIAEAHLRLGNIATARDLAYQQLDLSARTDADTQGRCRRIIALADGPAGQSDALGRAAECFEKSGDRLEHARTLATLSRLQLCGRKDDLSIEHGVRLPDRRRAAEPIRPAGDPDADGSDGTARSASPEVRSASPEVLSEAELRVAELAALGWSNREIGSNLFITVSTVEQHLTRVYRKLQVGGRRDLAGRLAPSVR